MLRAFIALSLTFAAVSHAAILRVAEGAIGAANGSSWPDAFPRLQDALSVAVAGDEVWVAAGVYYPDERTGMPDGTSSAAFRLRPSVPWYGGFSRTETLLSQRDPDKYVTVLSGDIDQDDSNADGNRIAETSDLIVGKNSSSVLRFDLSSGPALIDGFTVTAGDGTAALYVSQPGLEVFRCGFRGNKGTTAVNLISSSSFTHCTFSGNSGGDGAAVRANQAASFFGCLFQANNSNSEGGAVYSQNNLTFTDCSFVSNLATQGGGAIYHPDDLDSIILESCTFSGNSSLAGGGAVETHSPLSASNCSFLSNTAGTNGGALWIAGPVTLDLCTFAGNSAADSGGAVYNDHSQTKVSNSLFSSNVATQAAGAWIQKIEGNFPILNCTFSGNSSSSGGAYWSNFGYVDFRGCILWNNRQTSSAIPPASRLLPGAVGRFSRCIVQGSGGSSAWNSAAGQDAGGNRDVNPRFLVPADPALAPAITGNLRLAKESPGLDAGNNADSTGTSDLSGAPRIVNGSVDLGAYEGQNDQFDVDGDGLSDAFELAATTPPSRTALAPDLDLDGDGLSNRFEFVFGLDPRAADSGKAFKPLISNIGGQDYLSLRYRRNAWALQFLTVEAQRGLGLGPAAAWSGNGTTSVGVISLEGNVEEVTVRSTSPLDTHPKEFLRLEINGP